MSMAEWSLLLLAASGLLLTMEVLKWIDRRRYRANGA